MATLAVVLAIGGAMWNWLAIGHYRHLYPPPGKVYTVNGFPMHMYCTGRGSPPLILDSGLGHDWTVWGKVQPTLSQTTQVCSYDRSGLGWSAEQSRHHDASTVADQLHALLQAAGIQEPVVLMGHSMAGIYHRAYVSRYPNQVAGLIFVDASTPDQSKRVPPELASIRPNFALQKLGAAFGVARARGQCSEVGRGLEFERGWIYANNCKLSVIATAAEEFDAIDRSSEETRHTGPFGHLPILVLSQDPDKMATRRLGHVAPDAFKKWALAWGAMQEDLKRLSTNSHRVIARGSGHYVQLDRADLVNREANLFIQQVRGGTASPDNGTTRIE